MELPIWETGTKDIIITPTSVGLRRKLHVARMRFLDKEHFTPHFFSDKRQGTVTGAVATLLGTLLGKNYFNC